MSILNQISSGVSQTGLRIILAGLEKTGKTTLCAGAPGVLLVPLEVGYAGVNVAKTPMIQSLTDFNGLLDEIIAACQKGAFPYKTLAFDSATAMERLLHEAVVARDPLAGRGGKQTITIDTAHGGYGKGHTLALEEFAVVLKKLDQLAVYGGLNIIFTCHVFSSKVLDPIAGEYDSWDLLLHSPKNAKSYGKREFMTQWADVIGFIYEPVFVTESGKISKAVSQNKGRVLGVSRTPSYTAGNRFGMVGEIAIPAPPANGWNAFAEALHKASGIDLFTR